MPNAKIDNSAWNSIDTEFSDPKVKAAYDAYTAKQKEANKLRSVFEAMASGMLEQKQVVPEGKVPRFSHKWGKVSVAFVDGRAKPETKVIRL